ncbi:hypothetical protein J26TS2_41420 [Shouchella clausii]|nr:hypothetical protein J26TS2_41420 [Shouchella clausii]
MNVWARYQKGKTCFFFHLGIQIKSGGGDLMRKMIAQVLTIVAIYGVKKMINRLVLEEGKSAKAPKA